jgi:hypothetical protein
MNSDLLESSEDEAGFGSGGSSSEHSGKPLFILEGCLQSGAPICPKNALPGLLDRVSFVDHATDVRVSVRSSPISVLSLLDRPESRTTIA